MLSQYPVYASIPAKDIDRAKRFYVDVLGFTVQTVHSDGSLDFEAGDGTRFFVYPTQYAGTAKHTIAGFQVDDLDREIVSLKNKGIELEEYDIPGLKTIDGIATLGEEKSAWFKDSEGNIIGVYEPAHAMV